MTNLTFPSAPISNLSMRLKRVVAISESPFTLDTQVFAHQGARWEAEVSFPKLSAEQAKPVEAFILGLKGRENTFTFGNPLHTSFLSNGTVRSAAIRAETLELATGAASVVTAGTYFQLNNRLYCVTETKIANEPTLKFQPPLRLAVTSSQNVIYNLPKTSWRMAANDVGWSISSISEYGFSFACMEAL